MQGKTHRRSGRSRLRATGRADCIPAQAGLTMGRTRTGLLPPSGPPGLPWCDDPHNQDLAPARIKLSATAPGEPVEPAHRVAAQSVLDTLTRGDLTAYAELSVTLRGQLEAKARWGLAWATLMACDDEEARTVIEAVFITHECMERG